MPSEKNSPALFLTLSLLSVDLSIADVTLDMILYLFENLVSTIDFADLYTFVIIFSHQN